MSIQKFLDKIKNGRYGVDITDAIIGGIKQCYDDASVNHDNANMEVQMARGTHDTLNDRLDNVDEIQAQTNAQLSEIKSYNTPLEFEAIGDGVTDDTDSIQRLINNSTTKNLNFSHRKFLIGETITINTSGLKLSNGKIVSPDKRTRIIINTSDVHIRDMEFVNVEIVVGDYTGNTLLENISIENCKFDINVSAPLTIAIDLKCVKDVLIDNVQVYNTSDNPSSGIRMHNDANNVTNFMSENVIIRNCRVDGCNVGIHAYGTGTRLKFVFDGNYVTNCTTGIEMYHCSGNKCINNRVNKVGTGIWWDGGSIGLDGLPPILSHNQINNCTKLGVSMEEIRNGIVSHNVVMNCVGEGILCTSGMESTILSFNNIMNCEIGIAMCPSKAPTLIQGYFNINNTISDNAIQNCTSHGIYIEDHRRLLTIRNNLINSNNTGNKDGVFGIYAKAIQNIVVDNNTLDNSHVSSVKRGYQSGMCLAYTIDSSGVPSVAGNVERVSITNNRIYNTPLYGLYLGYTGISNGENTSGIISNNYFVGGSNSIKYPNTFYVFGNVGLLDGYISSSTSNSLRFNRGVASVSDLPAADATVAGTLVKINRSSNNDDMYYMCKRKSGGGYAWEEVF